ncbi:MAG TPA: methyltransferase domain-containing protein [Dictyobacter sp.]|jgi:23S rRNA G2445 N2-methylase RlmL|nr:methyltransferase domain-containing protein [Dictyobacter sp.]
MSNNYYAMTMPGLETLAFSEIRTVISDVELIKFARGIALFSTTAAPDTLLRLRTTEDVYFSLAHIKNLRHGMDGLRVLHSATLHADLDAALASWRQVYKGRKPRTWRVVSQMTGTYAFRRIDAGQTIAQALRRGLPHTMRQVEDDADVEFWCWLGGGDVLIGVRLSDATMRHRRYKREHLPASLRPTVAAAMGWLAQPTAQDIVLDPLCGAGTILIERALLAPVQQVAGGDIRTEAVAMAKRNAQSAHISLDVRQWDARRLPLEAASVTRIITNLPFGKQIGTHEQNESLYSDVLQEFRRVLTEDGLIVALTSEDRLWERVVQEQGWSITKKVVFVVLGQPASIFVVQQRK